MSKKIVVKLELHDGKDKQKAMKAVSALVGIDALSVDMAARKMTVIGTVDPVDVVSRLRKSSWAASIDSVGPAKEPEKEPEKKGEDGKKDGAGEAKKEGEGEKKDGGEAKKDGDDGKADEAKKDADGEKKTPPPTTEQQLVAELMNQYRAYEYNPYTSAPHYVLQSIEENPNSCTIC